MDREQFIRLLGLGKAAALSSPRCLPGAPADREGSLRPVAAEEAVLSVRQKALFLFKGRHLSRFPLLLPSRRQDMRTAAPRSEAAAGTAVRQGADSDGKALPHVRRADSKKAGLCRVG